MTHPAAQHPWQDIINPGNTLIRDRAWGTNRLCKSQLVIVPNKQSVGSLILFDCIFVGHYCQPTINHCLSSMVFVFHMFMGAITNYLFMFNHQLLPVTLFRLIGFSTSYLSPTISPLYDYNHMVATNGIQFILVIWIVVNLDYHQ